MVRWLSCDVVFRLLGKQMLLNTHQKFKFSIGFCLFRAFKRNYVGFCYDRIFA